MRVKVGDTWYSGEDVPIMVELRSIDKRNIIQMEPEAYRYAVAPDGHFPSEIHYRLWMDIGAKDA